MPPSYKQRMGDKTIHLNPKVSFELFYNSFLTLAFAKIFLI